MAPRKRKETGNEAGGQLAVGVGDCGHSLLVASVFSVRQEVRSSAEREAPGRVKVQNGRGNERTRDI